MADPVRGQGAARQSSGRKWALGIVAFVLFLFMVLNWHQASVNFIFFSVEMPLVFALLFAALLGALIGWAVPRLRRSS